MFPSPTSLQRRQRADQPRESDSLTFKSPPSSSRCARRCLASRRPRELAPPADQEDGRKAAHCKPLRPAERRSSFEVTNVASELRQAEHALDLGEEVRQFALEVRMHLACIDKTQELFTDQIFERAEKPEALPYVSSGVALRNPSPMKVSI